MSKTPANRASDEELMELGKKLQQFYDAGYVNKKEALMFSFIKGIVAGFGAFLGGTIVIALILWALSRFDQLPVIGPLSKTLDHSMHDK